MSIFDKFRARVLEPLSTWTYKSRSPVYPRKTLGFQVIKSGLSKYDPLQQRIKKWGLHIANRIVGYNKFPSGTYPIIKYPAHHVTAQKVSDRISYQKEFAKKHLTSAPSNWATDGKHSRLINFVDAETSSLSGSNVLSWSRLGVTYNYGTGKFEYVSSEDRFFLSRGGYTAGAEEVNRLNERNIKEFRTRHKVKYSQYYDEKESAYLRSQVAGSILAGHNILNADVGWLFGNVRGMSTMDTLVAAHNLYGKGGAGLEKLFSRLYKGLKPSSLGIQPHLSQHDVLMNVLVFEEMLRNAELNKDFKYIDKFIGAEYAPTDYYNGLKSSIILNNQYVIPRGTNIKAKWDATKDTYYANAIAEKYAEAVGASDYDPKKDIYSYDDSGSPVVNTGFSIVEPGEEGRVDLIGLNETPEDRATTKWLEEEERRLREAAAKKVTVKVKSKQRLIDKLVNETPNTGGSNIMEAKEWAEFVAVVKQLTNAAGTLSTEYRDLASLKASDARRQAIGIASRISSFEDAEDRRDYLDQLGIRGNEQEPYLFMADIQGRHRRASAKEAVFERAENLHAIGLMKDKVFDRLTQELNDSTVSLKDFKKSVNEAVQTIESKRQALLSYGSQQFYDPQALINATKHEWKSIMGAASGFMPGLIMTPVSHYGTAVINGLQSTLSGIKKWTSPINYGAQVVGNALIGSGAISPNPALMGAGLVVKGTAALGTQLYGRYKENQISQIGQDISMRLNLVSAGVQTVLLPFKLLATAARRLTKIFGGLSAVTVGAMYSGLKDMTHMGNPLSNLTGAGYGTYYNTMAGDYASLLAPGSTNAMMENLAAGSSMLYTMGQMDQNRVIASSMLGAFSNVYSANPDSMENITSMINHISKQMQGATPGRKRDLMTWAGMIDPSLPKILQSMDTLGISDYRTFMNPSMQGVRWTANRGDTYMQNWRKSFQMDQYQFQSINTNLGFNKDRIVHKMWQSFGFTLYNGFNKIVEMIADGRWKEAFDTIKSTIGEVIDNIKGSDAFKEFTGSFKDFIETLKKGKVGDILRSIHQTFKEIGKQIIAGILEGIEPLMKYLGDITFDPWKLMKGENPFGMKDYGKERIGTEPEALEKASKIMDRIYKGKSPQELAASGAYTFSTENLTIGTLRSNINKLRKADGSFSTEDLRLLESLGITEAALSSDNALAAAFGITNDFYKGFKQFQKNGVAEQMYEQVYNAGVNTISGAVSGVAGAISNVIKNETYVRLYIDGQAVASTFIDATGKLTKTGKGLLKAFVDEKGGM